MRELLAVALASVALAAPAHTGPFKVPVRERSLQHADGTVNAEALLASLNSTLAKYGHKALPALPTSQHVKRANGSEALTDQSTQGIDQLYYGPITVGAASQQFTVDFDTGSADLFIPGPQCGSAQGCSGSTKYNQQGQDQHNTTSVTYGSGSISGEDFKDTVTVAGLTVPDQGFISLTNASGFSQSKADGLMGMGFSTIARSGYATLMENLIAAGKVTAQEFSFYLGRAASNTQSQSELTLGGRDTARFTGSPISVPVTKKGYWQVAVDGVKVGGQTAGSTQGQAAIDTGTTIVLAPTAAASAIFAEIPGSIPIPFSSNGIQLYAFPCDTPNLPAVTFAGHDFAINKLDFNVGSLGLSAINVLKSLGADAPSLPRATQAFDYCIAGLGGADLPTPEPLYIVGDVFLKNWYSIFSYEDGASVSFAPAVGNQ